MTRKPIDELADLAVHFPSGHSGTENERLVLVCAAPISA